MFASLRSTGVRTRGEDERFCQREAAGASGGKGGEELAPVVAGGGGAGAPEVHEWGVVGARLGAIGGARRRGWYRNCSGERG